MKIGSHRGKLVFSVVFLIAISWAIYTQHAWEDYWITFKSSKNLATGQGLVFTPGERLHTFTSPLGVLLPAAASLLTANSSDIWALWIFRLWSSAALASAAVLLLFMSRKLGYASWAVLATLMIMGLDGKSIDFSINGMETGFLIFFISYTFWGLFACSERRSLHLGLAWAGLMWTRPDSFLYVGFLAIGAFIFNNREESGLSRWAWIWTFIKAGSLCTVLYLPWFVWAWSYYGSPIPHTVVAKGGVVFGTKTLMGAIKTLLNFPTTVINGTTSVEGSFLASYYQIGGWPDFALKVARWLGLVLAFQWILPWRREVRTASLAFCGMHVYLTYYPFFPFPWYLPGTTFLAAITLGGMIAQSGRFIEWLRNRMPKMRRVVVALVTIIVGSLIGGQSWLTWQMAREMKVEQEYSATGTRKAVALWLNENREPGQTVFMEPLGHIGYFSGLKTYDFPGLSSMETVKAIQTVSTDWSKLVEYLCPDWIVLRPVEYNRMLPGHNLLFFSTYKLVKEFSRIEDIRKHDIYGINYVEFDARMMIFRRQMPKRYRLDGRDSMSFEQTNLSVTYIEGERMHMLHAPSTISFDYPSCVRKVRISYALPPGSYEGELRTDGVDFIVLWTDGESTKTLASRFLTPTTNPHDRGLKHFEIDLPASDGETQIILMSATGGSDQKDWAYWGMPQLIL